MRAHSTIHTNRLCSIALQWSTDYHCRWILQCHFFSSHFKFMRRLSYRQWCECYHVTSTLYVCTYFCRPASLLSFSHSLTVTWFSLIALFRLANQITVNNTLINKYTMKYSNYFNHILTVTVVLNSKYQTYIVYWKFSMHKIFMSKNTITQKVMIRFYFKIFVLNSKYA